MKSPAFLTRQSIKLISGSKGTTTLSFIVILTIAISVFLLLSRGVSAATNKFWITPSPGNFNDNANWSLTSGGPANTTAPGSDDIAVFDANGPGNCTIAADASVAGIDISNISGGYNGTITVSAGVSVTVAGNGFKQAGGTFNGGNSIVDVNGEFLLRGSGVFNSTTGTLFLGGAFDHNTSSLPGGTFNHNSGTVTFDGTNGGINSELSGTVFNNLNFNHTGQRSVFATSGGVPTLTALGALALNDGQLFGNRIEARGNVTINPDFDGAPVNHATVVIANGGGPRIITFAAGINMLNVILNDPNATIQTSGSGTLNWRALTLQAGTINQGGVAFDFPPNGPGNYAQSGGTFNASSNLITFQSNFSQSGGDFNGGSGDIDVDGDFLLQGTGVFNSTTGTLFIGRGFDHNTASFPGGTFNPNNGTTVFDRNGTGGLNVAVSGETFNNLTFNLPELGQRGLSGGPFIALGTLTLSNGTLFGGTLQPQGNMVIDTTFDGGVNTSVTFTAPNNQTFTNNGGANPTGTWTINKVSGKVTLLTDLILGTAQSLNITSGTLDLGSSFNLTAGATTIGAAGILRNFGAGDLTLGSSLTNNGIFNFNGGTTSCGDPDAILIRSSTGGASRNWSGSGAFSIVDVDVQDQNATGIAGGVTAFTSTNSGNNTNWTFSSGCSVEVTTQPSSQGVCPGVSASFTVAASGTGLAFQWRKNGVNLLDGGNINGATTTTLTINPVGPSDHASYDVVVTNTFGVTATSVVAALTVAGVVTTTSDSGPGSFRQAILDVNGCAGLNMITFNITGSGVQTITPLSALPTITDPVIIDGTTQPGFAGSPLIELNGASAGGSVTGLNITAGGSAVRGIVINRFTSHGILFATNGGNTVQSCYIGTDVNGTADLGNTSNGVFAASDSHNNLIGGMSPSQRNIISGNGNGIVLFSSNNEVKGNFIGTDVTGTLSLGNSGTGVRIFASANNLIGGTSTAERNIVSGNGTDGVQIASGTGTNQVKGNFIGTDVTGTSDLGNASNGVNVNNSSNNIIGGITAAERNVISNNFFGVVLFSSNGNHVKGNFIGTDVNGTSALGNTVAGVEIAGFSNVIGGTTAAERNIISGNTDGVLIFSGATNNQVKGNFIGTDVNGTSALGNLNDGVVILNLGTTGNLIGGTSPVERNIISGNGSDGISIRDRASNNQVMGNFIGTDFNGTLDLGNVNNGVEITPQAAGRDTVDNKIGGTGAGEGNIIAFNARGVFVATAGAIATGNSIRGNSIFSNDNLGIDLDPVGVTTNDPGDGDTGPNNLQNFPSIVSANSDAASITIQASLSSTPNTFFNIDFYSSPTADPSGFGEGKVFLGSRPAATQDDGQVTFTATFNTAVSLGHFIIATANDLAGNTSEFSLAHVVSDAAACATLELVPTSASFNDSGGSGLINVTKAAGCGWTAVTNVSWITNVAPANGSGNGTVTYSVAANTSGCRSGTITVGGRTFTVTQSCPTAIELISFKAENYESGTFIEWQTGFEADNLGFNIYRDQGGNRTLVNSQLIAGSALTAGSTLGAGQSYSWWDDSPTKEASYWLEDIDLNGQSTWHGPFVSKPIGGKPPARSRAALLSELDKNRDYDRSTPIQTRASLVPLAAAQVAQSAEIATRVAVKIGVKNEGWYRVTQPQFFAAGFDVGVDPRFFQMVVDGKEQRIIVAGEDDGRFDPQDYVEFYGTGLDSPYTDLRVYWLFSGDRPGLRMIVDKSDGTPSELQSFTATVERRDRTIYFAALRNGEKENFFGAVIASSPLNQILTISNLAAGASGDAQLEVVLQGVTHSEHRVGVELNGIQVGEVVFNGQAEGAATFVVSHSLLREGQNSIRLTPVGGQPDVSLVDSIRIRYQHRFTADNDALKFSKGGGQRITIDGFTTKSIRIFDVTDPHSPGELLGEVSQEKSGYSITFASSGEGPRELLASASQPRSAELTLNQPSNVRNLNASFLMVTSRELSASLKPLAAAREKQGLSVAIADIEDVYDEFSFGQKTPFAVKNFISFANSNWKKKPRYLLFAGDSSYDPKNYLGFGDRDQVPTKLIDTEFIEASSDDWFSDFDGDYIANIPTGRLPVRSADELSSIVAKIIGYEQAGASEEALLVADANDGFDFERASTELRVSIPDSLRITQVNRGRVDAEMARRSLLEAIYRKQFLVNYVGHGSVNQWRGNLLTNDDARMLGNDHLPMFVMMTCLNGYFHDPALDSLGESLLKAERGGAIVVWGSSGMTMPSDQALLNQEFYRLLFDQEQSLTIGEAAMRAKVATSSSDVRQTWILLGDPTTRLR